METQRTIYLNPRTCHKVADLGTGAIDAYVFAKSLASLHKHAIIFNYQAKTVAIRKELGLTDHKYRKLFNAAISFNFIYIEGRHLRMLGLRMEKLRFKARHKHFQLIKVADIKPFVYISTLKKNQALQISTIRYKAKSQSGIKGPIISDQAQNEYCLLQKRQINSNVTCTYRKAAQLFGISISNAHKQLKALKEFGLIIKSDKKEISRYFFIDCLKKGCYQIRIDKKECKYYLVLPTTVKFDKFYKTNVINRFKDSTINNSYSYYCNDLIG